jgi:DNA polymerase
MNPARTSLTTTSSLGRSKLEAHIANWESCTRCPLHELARFVVIGRGSLPCDILFVGEAPGPREDDIGKPFIGPCKAILDDLIKSSVFRLRRTYKIRWNYTYAITNVVGCFPKLATPGPKGEIFREPKNVEAHACSPRLREFTALAAPRGVVLLGGIAQRLARGPILSVFPKESAIYEMKHPSYLLRVGEAGWYNILNKKIIL